MDEVVTEVYRKLLQDGFESAGTFDNPTMFIDTKAEGISICGLGGTDYMNIYIMIEDDIITDIKYLCSCDPTANVVIEALCKLVKGLTIDQAKALTKEQYYEIIGSDGGTVRRKVWQAIELLNRVFNRFQAAAR
ncbi:iron-sulfur cluster assembly scaffold protein [Chloroflexota bacterium]